MHRTQYIDGARNPFKSGSLYESYAQQPDKDKPGTSLVLDFNMSRSLFPYVVLSLLFVSGCNLTVLDNTPRALSYEVFVEPEMGRIRVAGTVDHLRKGSYYFALPRTQGFPPAHFVKYVDFSDAKGKLNAEITELGEWQITTSESSVSFSYHINLQQELKYQNLRNRSPT